MGFPEVDTILSAMHYTLKKYYTLPYISKSPILCTVSVCAHCYPIGKSQGKWDTPSILYYVRQYQGCRIRQKSRAGRVLLHGVCPKRAALQWGRGGRTSMRCWHGLCVYLSPPWASPTARLLHWALRALRAVNTGGGGGKLKIRAGTVSGCIDPISVSINPPLSRRFGCLWIKFFFPAWRRLRGRRNGKKARAISTAESDR